MGTDAQENIFDEYCEHLLNSSLVCSGNANQPNLYPPQPRSFETDDPIIVSSGMKCEIDLIFSS